MGHFGSGFGHPGREASSRGRGRGRGWVQPHANRNKDSQAQLPKPDPVQKRLHVLKHGEVSRLAGNTVISRVKDGQYVASYNWLDEKQPTIAIPGLPPTWAPPTQVRPLQQDSGTYYRDPNAARYPTHPVDPAVRAIFALNPEYESSEVDVFGCGGTLGSILSFVRKEERTFRFGVERVGNTVFLVRKTNQPKEVIEDVLGYGHTFPEEYTTWDKSVKNSATHQRIVSYDLGGLKCLVRSECDGFLPSKVSTADTKPEDNIQSVSDDEVLVVQLEHLVSRDTISVGGPLTMTQAGSVVSGQSLFDLKTRSIIKKDTFDIQSLLPRLWINRTPNLILGWHTRGAFHDIEIKDVRNLVENWEKHNAQIVAGFHALLRTLIQFSEQPNQTRFEVRRTENGPLEFWSEVKGWSALPKESKRRWKGDMFGADIEQEEDVKNKDGHEQKEEHQDVSSDSESEIEDYLKF